jgi:hypothetical protein
MHMAGRWLTVILCLLTLAGISVSLGCANAFSEDRNRMRVYSIRTDLNHMVDDVDWFFGLDEPSVLYEDSFPPGPQ